MKNNVSEEKYKEAAINSNSIASMCRYLNILPCGGNYKTINYKIKEYNIDTSHFTGKGWNVGLKFKPSKPKTLEEIMTKNSIYQSHKLKLRLISEGLKEHKCECCGNTTWLNEIIPLELHHKNGDKYDNTLENVQLLCPNCHSQTDNFRSKNKTKSVKPIIEKVLCEPKQKKERKKRKYHINKCLFCNKEFETMKKTQKYCSHECSCKVASKRPPYNDLVNKIKELNNNFTKLGAFYGVSDNAVRKWCRLYDLI